MLHACVSMPSQARGMAPTFWSSMASMNESAAKSPEANQPGASADRFSSIRRGILWCVLFLLAALAVLHWTQPDLLAPITMVPTWFWMGLMFCSALLCLRKDTKRFAIITLGVTLLFGFLFADEVWSLTRFRSLASAEQLRTQDKLIRVVTLNCNIGRVSAANEVKPLNPDIVLFQESPGPESLATLADELFGEHGQVISSGDTSILLAGRIISKFEDRSSHYCLATAELTDGTIITVACVRLSPPVYRLDFWNQRFWSKHKESRIDHRQQLQQVRDKIASNPKTANVIIGGDFNSVARDGAFDALPDSLSDAFRISGVGWGGTGANDYPIFRVDQIWASDSLQSQAVVSKKTKHSDHRMVVADLFIGENAGQR